MTQHLQLRPAKHLWSQQRTIHCLSADPDDCLVWCRTQAPAEVISLRVVVDTMGRDDYFLEYYTVELPRPVDPFQQPNQWHRVICSPTGASFGRLLDGALRDQGFPPAPSRTFDEAHAQREASLAAWRNAHDIIHPYFTDDILALLGLGSVESIEGAYAR